MLFLHKINWFYKLAQDSKSNDEKTYDWVVKHKLPTLKNLYEIHNWFKIWTKQPCFKIEDWLPAITAIVNVGGLWVDDINFIEKNFDKYVQPVMNHLLKDLIDEAPVWFGTKEYLYYEKNYVPADLLRRAQALLIKTWIDDFKYAEQYEPKREGNQASIDGVKADLAKLIGQLMDESKKFSPQFLMNLAKHFGIDTYVGAMNESRMLHGHKTYAKKTYTKFDIAYLFSSHLRSVDKEQLWKIIKKCNDDAKQYMRGYLYEDTRNMGHPSALFMLSEDLTPMNIDYQGIAWPDGIRIITLDELRDEALRNRWARVFQDFHIIPN